MAEALEVQQQMSEFTIFINDLRQTMDFLRQHGSAGPEGSEALRRCEQTLSQYVEERVKQEMELQRMEQRARRERAEAAIMEAQAKKAKFAEELRTAGMEPVPTPSSLGNGSGGVAGGGGLGRRAAGSAGAASAASAASGGGARSHHHDSGD